MQPLKTTRSICPECFKVIDAKIYEENEEVFIEKTCPEHGSYKDVYWEDAAEYKRAQEFTVIGSGIENPMTPTVHGHPFDCGLCPQHKTETCLGIIDVTNRCNLRCPVCFANAAVSGVVYEPTREQIATMLKQLRNIKPVPATALQFSGGEPTVREDLPDLIRLAKEVGFEHVEVNTNGIRLAQSVDYCRELANAGASTIYLQFDGVTREPYIAARGLDLLDTKLQAIENCRKAEFDSVVLVPTIVKGVNDHQLGDIVRFAAQNFDVIRCVNFQPVSITGRIDYEKRRQMRITIPKCIKLIEEQTDHQIQSSDFYPIPCVVPVSQAVGALKGRDYVDFTVHEHCGMATFLFIEDDKLIPITKYANVDQLLESMKKVTELADRGAKTRARLRLLTSSLRHVRFGILKQLMEAVLNEGSYSSLGQFMRRILMIGMMHFQDPYNFDLERLERCGIHYAVPDGRVIPFCAMNSIYRTQIEQEFGIPLSNNNNSKQ